MAENEKRSERNEKAVAVRRDAGPIGVAGNEKVKSEKGGKKRSADQRFTAPENEKSDEGEKKNRCPGEKTVIGREKHGREVRGCAGWEKKADPPSLKLRRASGARRGDIGGGLRLRERRGPWRWRNKR